jgi:glycosyltransferase involved in cell wall biosynthesis
VETSSSVPGTVAEPWLDPGVQLIVTIGPLEPDKGMREAVWVLDILKFLAENIHLAVIGEGPERGKIERFSQGIQAADRVHFLGERGDVAAWLARADLVWVLGKGDGGVNAALEAMAAGQAVIATRRPALAEIIDSGATGILAPSDDKPALARLTRQLLSEPEQRRQLGAAARSAALERFSTPRLVDAFARLYDGEMARER